MAKKKQWSNLSAPKKAGIVAAGVAELAVTAVALRDLIRRPASRVRGPKALWYPVLFVQPVGSPLYLVAGRRSGAGR
jgi:hypothetical protein